MGEGNREASSIGNGGAIGPPKRPASAAFATTRRSRSTRSRWRATATSRGIARRRFRDASTTRLEVSGWSAKRALGALKRSLGPSRARPRSAIRLGLLRQSHAAKPQQAQKPGSPPSGHEPAGRSDFVNVWRRVVQPWAECIIAFAAAGICSSLQSASAPRYSSSSAEPDRRLGLAEGGITD